MALNPGPPKVQSWTKDNFLISTDVDLIPMATLQEAFASDLMYWASSLPEDTMRRMLQNSLCFALYDTTAVDKSTKSTPALIGFARCCTDYVTLMYLTDVFIDPAYQGKGLGSWLIACVQAVIDAMPALRRSVVLTANWEKSVPFYEKLMGVEVHESKPGQNMAVMMRSYHPTLDTYLRKNITHRP